MSLDDLIGAFTLGRLDDQNALARELLAMNEAGVISCDRRARYTPTLSARSGAGGSPKAQTAAKKTTDSRPDAVAPRKLVPRPARVGEDVEGTIAAHRDGYGFLMPGAGERGPQDVFLPPHEMKTVMHGDRARVRLTDIDERGRREGVLVEVLERARAAIVGRIILDGDHALLAPSNPRLPELRIAKQDLGGARQGQVVVAELARPPSERAAATGRVVEILGEHLAAGMEIETSIRAYGLPQVWSAEVEAEAAAFGARVTAAQMHGREDLRALPWVTIDGADARDFDDAVCAQPARGGWTLWVAIADVSAYVTPGSALDVEAQSRGTSVYFPERVVPMLPEALSNGLCSLNPQVNRLCMVCEMRVRRDGEVTRSRFYPAVMRSHARLVYEQVAAALDDANGGAIGQRHAELVEPLRALDAVYGALFEARSRRGAIDFESTETKIRFGADRKIESIVPVERTRAHRLIEECMIAANVEAAKFAGTHEAPALYRVHAPPDADKVTALREFLGGRGVTLGGGAAPQPSDYAAAVASLGERPDAGLIQTMMLRSLMQARYSPTDDGHFGLALEHYAHFTSPIRRYPDLLLHRAIKRALARRKADATAYSAEQMAQFAQSCSMTERRADEATRDVVTWLKCEYMSHRVGESFDGVVTGVAPFGVFVELEGLYVDGMIHISRLGSDYFEHDPSRQRLVGTRSGRVVGLGERLRVRLMSVNLDERKIDLEAADGNPRGRRDGDAPRGRSHPRRRK